MFIMFAGKWKDKVTDVNRVKGRMIIIKVLVQGIIVSFTYSVWWLTDWSFYDGIGVDDEFREKKIAVIAGDFNRYVRSSR